MVVGPVSLDLGPGITVLLGPNGAGKTTLLRTLAGLHPLTSGTITRTGVSNHAWTRSAIAHMSQDIDVVPGLSVTEQIEYAGWLHGLSMQEARQRTPAALARTRISDLRNRKVNRLSGGERRRLGLAELLVFDPDLILLDEPTVGLDPHQRSGFRELVRDLGSSATVVMSTHQVDDLDSFADRAIALQRGQVIFDGSLDDFYAHHPLTGGIHAPPALADPIAATRDALAAERAYVHLFREDGP